MNAESSKSSPAENAPSEVGPPNPQYPITVEISFTLPEETITRIRAEADRDQTSESEALIKIVAAYQAGI